MQFWQPSQKTFGQSENFPLNVGTRKCKVFIGKFFCSTCSHVHLESSFDNPVEEFVTKCRWLSARHLKFLSIIFSKCCYGHVEGSFDNLIKKVSTKSRKQFDRGPEKIIINAFLKINLASIFFLRHVETSSVKPGENVLLKAENFRSMTECAKRFTRTTSSRKVPIDM